MLKHTLIFPDSQKVSSYKNGNLDAVHDNLKMPITLYYYNINLCYQLLYLFVFNTRSSVLYTPIGSVFSITIQVYQLLFVFYTRSGVLYTPIGSVFSITSQVYQLLFVFYTRSGVLYTPIGSVLVLPFRYTNSCLFSILAVVYCILP